MKIELDEKDRKEIAELIVEKLKEILSNKNQKREIKFMTIDELCSFLKTKKSFIYHQVHYGLIPHQKIGRKLRFVENDILNWMKKIKEKN